MQNRTTHMELSGHMELNGHMGPNRYMGLKASKQLFGSAMLALCLMLSTLPAAHARDLSRAPGNIADKVEDLTPAVVNISTTQKIKGRLPMLPEFMMPDMPPGSPFEDFRDFFEQFQGNNGSDDPIYERKAYSLGSGFVISPEGFIVTNNHVIADAEEITVRFSDDSEYQAEIIGRDSKTDLALLKIDAGKTLPYVSFGNSDEMRVGDWVIAIGNPFGLGGTVTLGIISAKARDINAGPFDNFLQTDAAINTGNSGGPMFNLNGKVVGINTAIFSPSGGNVGIGFATPSSLAKTVVEQLKAHGKVKWGWLGVKIQTVTSDIADSLGMPKAEGALVVQVSEGSPADRAGIRSGDVIQQFDGKPVPEMRDLPRVVAETPVGKEVRIVLWRDGGQASVRATLGEAKETEVSEAPSELIPSQPTELSTHNHMGMELAPTDQSARTLYEMPADVEGLYVTHVERGSPAWERGIRADDIILKVNEDHVTTVEGLKLLLEKAKEQGRNFALLRIYRDGDTHFVTLPTDG